MGFKNKIAPLKARVLGLAPLCPWNSVLRNMHPATFRVKPPQLDIQVVATTEKRHLLRFGGKHDFWFPSTMSIDQELWSEYLVVAWEHRVNAHYYLRHSVTLGPKDVVLDCGSCEGFFARQALEIGVEKVVCVEPNREMAACLNATFEAEISSGRLIVVPVALGSLTGEAKFSMAAGDAFSGHFHEDGEDRVPIITLEQLVSQYGRPSMIKMDLEGSEYEALKGGSKFLSEYRPKLAITAYHEAWDSVVISGLIRGAAYQNLKVSASIMRDGVIPRPVMIHAW